MNYEERGEEWSDAMYAGVTPEEIAEADECSVRTVLRVVEKYRYQQAEKGYDDD